MDKLKQIADSAINPSVSQLHQQLSDSHSISSITLKTVPTQKDIWLATVVIPAHMVNALYAETARLLQNQISAPGFSKDSIPIAYVQENFEKTITEHLKEFLFKYTVSNTLFKNMRLNKTPIAGEPRLINIELAPNQDAQFHFECTVLPKIDIKEWKYLPFKSPRRKNYKDLDRQVASFVAQEQEKIKESKTITVAVNDWVLFTLTIINEQMQPLLHTQAEQFWFKISDEEVDNPLKELLLGKEIRSITNVANKGLQDYFCDQLDAHYLYRIEITDILSHADCSLEPLKKHFRIKNNKEMNKKLIEVFSYRNDISQRRAIVEETLQLLIAKNPFSVPNHTILREQERVLEAVKNNPDYNVYRMQKDFQHKIRQLAEKNVQEKLFIDQLAYHENISISDQDVKNYLSLTLRPRTKEFIYFKQDEPIIEGQEVPIPAEEFNRTCLREKTINYAIYHLTKK
jgi:FKBP-type peptidyl-prolyl cis-trans isomerase (trigger factor)